MQLLIIFATAVGLAIDAFAASVIQGSQTSNRLKVGIICAISFGAFQFFMTFFGGLLGDAILQYIANFDHWVAFSLLSVVGVKMILEAFEKPKPENQVKTKDTKKKSFLLIILLLSFATSIDALAVGFSFAITNTPLVLASVIIGAVAFVLSFTGVFLGSKIGSKYKKSTAIIGGAILIIIGAKILIEHLFFL